MSALTEILSDNLVFVRGQDMVEGLANKLQREEVGGSAMREDHDLDFNREAPRRGRGFGILMSEEQLGLSKSVVSSINLWRTAYPSEEDPGMSLRDLSLAPAFVLLIAARNFCNGSNLEKPVILGFATTWINQLR